MNMHLMNRYLIGAYLTGVHLMGVCLMGVYLKGVFLIGVYFTGVYLIYESSFAHDTGGENPCIDTKDVLRLLIVGDSAVRLPVTLRARSAW
jgi:hypothetical protein